MFYLLKYKRVPSYIYMGKEHEETLENQYRKCSFDYLTDIVLPRSKTEFCLLEMSVVFDIWML